LLRCADVIEEFVLDEIGEHCECPGCGELLDSYGAVQTGGPLLLWIRDLLIRERQREVVPLNCPGPNGHPSGLCSYYWHYEVWYDPGRCGPKLSHAAFHEAERRCEEAHRRLDEWYRKNGDATQEPQALVRQCEIWERKVAA
jgi:hypothetical protein